MMVVRLVIDIGELLKLVLKSGVGNVVGVWRKSYAGCWIVWPLCVFGCIYVVVVEGAFVKIAVGLGCV
jgi:hypothetical protein